jgi:hypothetical protein
MSSQRLTLAPACRPEVPLYRAIKLAGVQRPLVLQCAQPLQATYKTFGVRGPFRVLIAGHMTEMGANDS